MDALVVLLAPLIHGYDPFGTQGRNPCDASSDKYQSCWTTRCCRNSGFLCMKKVGKDDASCQPWIYHRAGEHEPCADDAQWLCPTTHHGPGWDAREDNAVAPTQSIAASPAAALGPACLHGASPTAPFSNCFESRCCAGEGTHGCFRRFGRAYAQCRPFSLHAAADGGCSDSDLWLCPDAWMPPRPSSIATRAPAASVLTPTPSPLLSPPPPLRSPPLRSPPLRLPPSLLQSPPPPLRLPPTLRTPPPPETDDDDDGRLSWLSVLEACSLGGAVGLGLVVAAFKLLSSRAHARQKELQAEMRRFEEASSRQ